MLIKDLLNRFVKKLIVSHINRPKTETNRMLSLKTFFNIALVFSMMLCFFYSLASSSSNTPNVLIISAKEAASLQNNQDIAIVDVRTARSWWRSNAKIRGADRGDPAIVKEWEPQYPHDKILILYCS